MAIRWLIILTLCPLLSAQQLSQYDIHRATSPIVIDGKLDEAAWRDVPSAGNFHPFRGETRVRQQTLAKLAWDDENLYVGYYCLDKKISAYVTERNGPVSRDDCVEVFISPNPAKVRNYYTFEINAIGAMLNRARTDWWNGPPFWDPDGVRYRATWQGQTKKDPAADDDHWILEMAVPFRNFAKDAAHTPPHDGDEWRLNLNRLEGVPNNQPQEKGVVRRGLSTWSPLPAELRSFHSPDWFGRVRFVDRTLPR
jgi:hypothetical protein